MATPYVKQTWIDNDNTKPVSAARLGVIESGIFDAHYRPSVLASNTGAALSIPNTTLTATTWATEVHDTDNMHSTSVNTARLTAPVAGKYMIVGRFLFNTNATGFRFGQIRVNGTTPIGAETEQPLSGTGTSVCVVVPCYPLAASDYVEFLVQQTSGGALAAISATPDSQSFGMQLVSY